MYEDDRSNNFYDLHDLILMSLCMYIIVSYDMQQL